tara:strand:+ start:112 stop:423 length:312 start_codon:yes stop_codon:yes gene_type:complete
VVDLVVRSMDLVDIQHTQLRHMVMLVVVGVVVLDMRQMDLELAEIKFKHHNRKVQMEQIMEVMAVMPLEETMLEVAVEASDKMDTHHQLTPLFQDLLQEEVMG